MFLSEKVDKRGMIHFRIIKSFRNPDTRKTTSKTIKDLGCFDPNKIDLEKKRIEFNEVKSKLESEDTNKLDPRKVVAQDRMKSIDESVREIRAGYLFPQAIFYALGFKNICSEIKEKSKFEFNLETILRDLIIGRIIESRSKRGTYELAQNFIRKPKYTNDDIYNAMDVILKNYDFINRRVFQNRTKLFGSNTNKIFYDCMNIFFETEIEDEDLYRSYGKSKEHRPNPIVQIGLLTDYESIPLDIITFNGKSNEQPTLVQIEDHLKKHLDIDKFIVCTDCGLNSEKNMIYNSSGNRSFISAASLKKLKQEERDILMNDLNWKILGMESEKYYKLSDLKKDKALEDKVFYKEDEYKVLIPSKEKHYVNVDGKKELIKNCRTFKYIITFSKKVFDYQRNVRNKQIERALKYIEKKDYDKKTINENDPRRFIKITKTTSQGEVADNEFVELDQSAIDEEMKYDGYYLCNTNLINDNAKDIIKINEKRWEIEETFRIMKSDLNIRPVFHSRKDRIDCHVKLCYFSILLLRLLEKQIDEELTMPELLQVLHSYNLKENQYGYGACMRLDKNTKLVEDKMQIKASYDGMFKEDLDKINRSSKEWYKKKFEPQRLRGKNSKKIKLN